MCYNSGMKNLLLIVLVLSLSLNASDKTEKTVLLCDIARDAVLETLLQDKRLERTRAPLRNYPFLTQKAATFVTLEQSHRLRGCIGSLRAHRAMFEDIVHNARAAAFEDPRFPPLRADEYDALSFEVSVLSRPEPVEYETVEALKKKIKPGRDGIILKMGEYRATFLPQVWNEVEKFDDFFAFLCLKAGLGKECLKLHPSIERYRVEAFSDARLQQRPAVQAGRFYPSGCLATEKMFRTFERRSQRPKKVHRTFADARAVVVPHAGYRYSGYTADRVYAAVSGSGAEHIVVLGPSHRVYFKGVSAPDTPALATPCGPLRSDESFIRRLRKEGFPVSFRQDVHEKEHSTEVQFPFIRHYLPYRRVSELVYGEIGRKDLEALIERILREPGTLLIVSTDLSHYHPAETAHRIDYHCLDAVADVDPGEMKRCEACGKAGLEALLSVAKKRGLESVLIDYRTSADTTGDTGRVVGYMGAVFY